MSHPIVLDMIRELNKARSALIAAQSYLSAHAEANAALHCASETFHSPLHAVVTAAIQGTEKACLRAEATLGQRDDRTGPQQDPGSHLAAVLLDLDRCAHGRHSVDNCIGCDGGQSTGNLLLPPGMLIGHSQGGSPIVVPEPSVRYDWTAWRTAPVPNGGGH